ncbi:MAG: ABC transporter substrate-binding protein [Alphaproteobacteria bacterium]|nr:ABC transporter substrate-binding protein [Alphaproteobacteria bacterium]
MKSRLATGALAALLLLTAGAAAEPVSVAALRLSSSGPLFIAEEAGFFRGEGLEVTFRFFTAAQPVAVAVTTGDADFGVTGLTAGFYNLAGKGALKIIAAQSADVPGFHLSACLATPRAWDGGLRGLADFPGRSVGITQTGSTFHYMIGLLARKQGFDLARVRLVPLQSIPNMVSAFRGGQVDALILPSSVALPMLAREEAKLLGWVGDATPWQLGALFTSGRTAAERRPLVARFVRAYRRGAAAYHAAFNAVDAAGRPVPGPGHDAFLAILAKYTQQPAEQIRTGLPWVDPDGRLDVGDIHDQVAWWQAQKLVDPGVDAGLILDLGFVEGHRNVPR